MASAKSVEQVRAEIHAMQRERGSPDDSLGADPDGDVAVESRKAALRACRDLQIQMFRQYEEVVAELDALQDARRGLPRKPSRPYSSSS